MDTKSKTKSNMRNIPYKEVLSLNEACYNLIENLKCNYLGVLILNIRHIRGFN